MKKQQSLVTSEWQAAGRAEAPQRIGGFWFSLAPNADERLKAYVHKYIRFQGDAIARAYAATIDRSTPDAVRASLDAYEELGLDECWLNSATAELSEIDNLLELLQKRG
jgi:hypothetical protein